MKNTFHNFIRYLLKEMITRKLKTLNKDLNKKF